MALQTIEIINSKKMPLGDIAGELLRPFVEIVLYGAAYWTGYIFVKIITFGTADIASFWTIDEKRKKKIKKSVQLKKDAKVRADATAGIGFLVWVVIGLFIYFSSNESVNDSDNLKSVEGSLGRIVISGEFVSPKTWRQPSESEHSLNSILDEGGGVSSMAFYLYVVRELDDQFELHKFRVKNIKAGQYQSFKVLDNDIVYVRGRESALNIRNGIEISNFEMSQ